MKEDILEQLTEDCLHSRGYFTKTNVKYKPDPACEGFISNQDCVASDIDVLAVNPTASGHDRVLVVTCKSWQSGFWPELELSRMEKKVSGRLGWQRYRELWIPKWSTALAREVKRQTGEDSFTHVTAVTILGDARTRRNGKKPSTECWLTHERFRVNLPMAKFVVLELEDMVAEIMTRMSTTVENSPLGRTLQLLHAAGYPLRPQVHPSREQILPPVAPATLSAEIIAPAPTPPAGS
jgi:hypothetical protein